MSDLASKRCKPCEGGASPLTHAEAKQHLHALGGDWMLNATSTVIASTTTIAKARPDSVVAQGRRAPFAASSVMSSPDRGRPATGGTRADRRTRF